MFPITHARLSVLMLVVITASALPAGNAIQFDVPPTVVAIPVADDAGRDLIECPLRVSSLIASPSSPRIDQWLIVCQPRNADMTIVDYCPKTGSASNIEGPIVVKKTDESSLNFGLSVSGDLAGIAGGNIGADRGDKQTDSRQYSLKATQHAVTASGTINRGRAVYFKWRRSANQILEGDKTLKLIFQVPDHWRGSLIDIFITAQSEKSTLGGLDKQIKTMGQSNFVVAIHRDGDQQAANLSRQLADAEHSLRHIASEHPAKPAKVSSLSGMLKSVAVKSDLHPAGPTNGWVGRLLQGEADPYLDKEIQRLPMETRLAVLDYCQVREQFDRLVDANNIGDESGGEVERFAAQQTSFVGDER